MKTTAGHGVGVEWVFMDLGNVLYGLDSECVLKRFSDRCGNIPAELYNSLNDNDLMRSYDRGSISSRTFFEEASPMLQCNMDFDEFQSIWNSLLIPRRRMFTVARHLQRQVGLLFLSNTNEMHASVIDPDVRALTDKIIYSYRAGCLKPQRALYQRALKMSRASPGKTLFIDDSIENLQGAASLGIRTHHFQNRKTLCRMLRSFGLKMPLFFP